MENIPEQVNLSEYVKPNMKRPDGNTPLKLSSAELKERRAMRRGEVKYYAPGQVPEFNPTTFRKRQCPVCNYSNGRLMATCYRCRTCYACGSYCGELKDDNCPTCGNFNNVEPPENPIIIVN